MEHVEVLERLRDRWVMPGERPALDAAIAALSAPQPPAEAQEVVCLECGQPTMHMGQVCYACSHPAEKPAEAQAQARAERLSEALRHLRNHTSVNSYQIELIDAALRDHDQEGKDG